MLATAFSLDKTDDLILSNKVFSKVLFICSYGLTNRYHHPSFQVIAALGEAQKQVFFSTERHMVEYDFFIKFKKSHGL